MTAKPPLPGTLLMSWSANGPRPRCARCGRDGVEGGRAMGHKNPERTGASMDIHPAAEIFPLDAKNIDSLAEDIRDNGQRETIKLLGGCILDGRRRYEACRRAGVLPNCEEVNPSDPITYVISFNLHRRHLTPGGYAMAAGRAKELREKLASEARERMNQGRPPAGKGRPKEPPVNLPEVPPSPCDTRDQIGKLFGVSGKTVDYAVKVLENAVPEVVQAVDEGRMSVSHAATIAHDPVESQRAEASEPRRRRNYQSVSKPLDDPKDETATATSDEEAPFELPNGKKRLPQGVILANEALDCLRRISTNDPQRKLGFQIVMDWLKHNK